MASIDKIDGINGSTRAALATDRLTAPFHRVVAVGLDTSGRVVNGIGNSGIVGLLVLTKRKFAGDIVDVMRGGEIVEFDPVTVGTLGVAGTVFTANTVTGAITTAAVSATQIPIGHTVEAGRLVVNVKCPGGAP